jgi:anti-anti-sigma factor
VSSALIQGKLFVTWDGEVCFRNVEGLTETINDAADQRATAVEIDMRDVTFIDSSGLQALVSARRRFPGPGGVRVLVTEGAQPDRVLRLAKLEIVLGVVSHPRSAQRQTATATPGA